MTNLNKEYDSIFPFGKEIEFMHYNTIEELFTRI